ncbi:MAG: enoyl-CoA hydratase-related protein [Thermaerobacter sp.]
MSDPRLLVERREGSAWITLNRPEVHNAIDWSMWRRLREILLELDADPSVRVVVLQGAGDRAFSAGSDLAEFARLSTDEVRACFRDMELTIATVERISVPVVASVQGYVLGSALELMLACDVQIASRRARFGMPIARLGIMLEPPFAGRLVRVIGPARTRDLLFSGRQLSAAEAARAGMVARLVAPSALKATVDEYVATVLAGSPRSIEAAKRSVRTVQDRWLPGPDGAEEPYYIDEADFREGVSAFLAKRKPQFEGRRNGAEGHHGGAGSGTR